MIKHLLVAVSFISLMVAVQQANAAADGNGIEQSGPCKGLNTMVDHDIAECESIQAGIADKQLNEVYKQLAARLDDGQKQALKHDEMRWIKSKNKTCPDAGAEVRGGTAEAVAVEGCYRQMTEDRVKYLQNYGTTKVSQGTLGVVPVASVTAATVAAVATDNPSIESWVKACTPFTAPTNLEKAIGDGKVTFRGIKVAAVDSADGGASSLVSLRLAMSAADLKTRYPELSKKIKLPKSKACPLGIERTLADHSFTGAVGATIGCSCLTGGD